MFSATPSPLPAGPSKAVPARVSKRLVKELAHLQKDPPPNVAAWPVKDNAHKIHARQPLLTTLPSHSASLSP